MLPKANVRSYRQTHRQARNNTRAMVEDMVKEAHVQTIFARIIDFLDLKMLVHIGLYARSLKICLGDRKFVKIVFTPFASVNVKQHWGEMNNLGDGELLSGPPLKYWKAMIKDVDNQLKDYRKIGTNAEHRKIYDEAREIIKRLANYVRGMETYLKSLTNIQLEEIISSEDTFYIPKRRTYNFVRKAFPSKAFQYSDSNADN